MQFLLCGVGFAHILSSVGDLVFRVVHQIDSSRRLHPAIMFGISSVLHHIPDRWRWRDKVANAKCVLLRAARGGSILGQREINKERFRDLSQDSAYEDRSRHLAGETAICTGGTTYRSGVIPKSF